MEGFMGRFRRVARGGISLEEEETMEEEAEEERTRVGIRGGG